VSFLMPLFLWLVIPFIVFFMKSPKSITIQTHILILILLLIALARPIQKEVLQEANIGMQDIIIAIDISYSMQANDLSPTRYLFAKKTIKHLLSRNATDHVMLIAFTSNPLLLSPPSTDHALVGLALDNLNPEFILTKGTSLKRLFKKLSSLPSTPKTLILMTDGGEESNVEELVQLLDTSDIALVTLALGSKQGTTVSKSDGSVLKNKEGNLVITHINPLLHTLTQQLNGTYLSASVTPEATAKEINTALKENEKTHRIQKEQHHYKDLYQIPLLLATLLFLLLHTRAVKYLIILFTFLGLPLQASLIDEYTLYQSYAYYNNKDYNKTKQRLKEIDQPSLQSQILLANTHYKEGNYQRAIQIYSSIKSTSPSIKQELYYNTANAYVYLHQYTKAKIYYIKALQLGFDTDAIHNLKITMFLEDTTSASLGIAHPKSQSAQTSKSENQDKKKEEKEEDKPSSASSSGAGATSKEKKKKQEKQKKHTLISNDKPQKQPLGSKVYELINKGYIHETQPW